MVAFDIFVAGVLDSMRLIEADNIPGFSHQFLRVDVQHLIIKHLS